MERFRSIKQPNNSFGGRLVKLLIVFVILVASSLVRLLSIGSIGRTLSISYGGGQVFVAATKLQYPRNYRLDHDSCSWFPKRR